MSLAALDAHIARVKALGHLGTTAAPRVARTVERFFKLNIAAARGPDGKAWKLREDGGKALTTEAGALRVVVVDAVIFARLTGYMARHNNGTARGGVDRPTFPARGIPAALARAITADLTATFNAEMKP